MKKPILVKTELDGPITELVKKCNHRIVGIWAADCAERVLPYFEEKYPKDDRPRKAIEALRTWIKNGTFKMADVRKASLDAHAAAREVKETDEAARSAARSAGQAIATAHVPTHAIAAATYAASTIRNATDSMNAAIKERDWQYHHLLSLNKTIEKNHTQKQKLWREF